MQESYDFYDAILYPDIYNKHYKISQSEIKNIFYNKLEDLNKFGKSIEDRACRSNMGYAIFYNDEKLVLDSKTKYSYNSLEFRSPEFNDAEILIAGCSYSFGLGVPEECIWGVSVAKTLNASYANIGRPAVSVDWIVDSVIAYLRTYRHPKIIMCLFPDFTRVRVPINPNINKTDISYFGMPKEKEIFTVDAHFSQYMDIEQKPEILKKPYHIENALGIELSVFISIKKILILEDFCKSIGVKFLWSVWEPKLHKTLIKIQNDFEEYESFVNLDVQDWVEKTFGLGEKTDLNPNGSRISERFVGSESFSWHKDQEINNDLFLRTKDICHLDLKEKYPEYFYWGSDTELVKAAGHWGAHKHQHIAESFLERVNDDNTWNK